jgi:Ca2+-binding RTX toxin-like protein
MNMTTGGSRSLSRHRNNDSREADAPLYIRAGGPQPQALAISGTDGPDVLNGTPDDDQISGGGGDDVLNGLGGNDWLFGGAGADTTDGGTGDDWHFIDNAGDVVIDLAGEGNDRVFSGVSYTLTAGAVVEIFSTDWHEGFSDINLTGNELSNLIYGNYGNNILIGGLGADTLVGMGGIDWYYVDNAADVVVDADNDINEDRVFTSVSYTLSAGARIEKFTTDFHAGTAAINLTGNEFGQTIHGNDGNNILDGAGGNDVLYGRAGNDIFLASAGFDTFHGEAGDDWFYINDAQDWILEGPSQGSLDRVFTSVSYTLPTPAAIEIFSTDDHAGTGAINLTGNDLVNTIYGNQGNNILDGKGGSDVLIGWGGADTFAFTTQPRVITPANIDTVYDFEHGIDKIALDDAIFNGIGAPGSFNANAFALGTAAGDADDRIIYDQATGQLFYDEDGTGAIAARLFANLEGAPILTVSDFVVI